MSNVGVFETNSEEFSHFFKTSLRRLAQKYLVDIGDRLIIFFVNQLHYANWSVLSVEKSTDHEVTHISSCTEVIDIWVPLRVLSWLIAEVNTSIFKHVACHTDRTGKCDDLVLLDVALQLHQALVNSGVCCLIQD